MLDEMLIEKARKAMEKAYAPYSKFKVGAAVLTADDVIFTGCNVENISFGATNCAERTAVFSAVAAGYRDFKAIAVISISDDITMPCGICRQVMAEFKIDRVICASHNGDYKKYRLKELLPHSFDSIN